MRTTRRSVTWNSGIGALTLMEVLVVVGIIAILASLLVPTVSSVMHRARSARCRSNLRDTGKALVGYVNTHNQYPRGIDGFFESLYPERTRAVANANQDGPNRRIKIAQCPNAKRPQVFKENRERYTDYGYNATGLGGMDKGPSLGLGHKEKPTNPVHTGDVVNPSGMLAAGDGFWAWGDTILDNGFFSRSPGVMEEEQSHPDLYRKARKRVRERHSRHVNVVFCDGHSSRLSLGEVFFETNTTALSRWNRDHQPHRERLP